MKISSSNLIMRHCPHCDNICLFSKADIDILQAENKSVRISCHQCQKQFSIDSDETNDKKIGRPAKLKLITCPSCKNQVAMPHSIPNLSDWIIDLGPDGGDKGGEIVVEGTPEEVAQHPTSYTAKYLKRALK